MIERTYEKFFRQNRLPHLWCPGCGNGIVMAELNFGQLVGEVRRAANGQCPVKLCAKYDMTIFEPEEIVNSIEELIREVNAID